EPCGSRQDVRTPLRENRPRGQRSRPIQVCGSERLIVSSKSIHTGCQQENAMARVVRFHETGGPAGLKVEPLDGPPPRRGKGEVQIRVKALGLNRAESMFRRGEYLEQPDFPARIGYEAAGTVAAVGPGGDGFKVGDAVSTIPAFSMNQYGVYGDLVSAPGHAVAHPPASLSWEQAASIWMQYLTGYGALIDIADLKAGDALVIPAASSSVGLAAIQIANRVGATPIALTR